MTANQASEGAAEQAGRLGAIILANGGPDKLARHLGAAHKALIEVNGQPMVMRVVEALQGCSLVDRVAVACLAGGPVAEALRGKLELAEAEGDWVLDGIAAGFATMPAVSHTLLATCDLPLLSSEAVREVADHALEHPDADLIYAMVDAKRLRRLFPETRRTTVRLREGAFTAGGLSVVSRRFVEGCGPQLTAAFKARKSKIALARLLGVGFLIRFFLGMLSVDDIVERASDLMGCKARAVQLACAESGFDVDSVRDLTAAEQALRRLAG